MRISYIVNALSLIMMYIGIVLVAPALVAVYYHDFNSIFPFISAALISAGTGYLLRKIVPSSTQLENLNDIKKSEGLFIVAASWVIFALIAAIPYPFFNLSIINSLFEATSGITTTGATILTHFDYPKAFFFWRSFTQWIGGMGIIIMFIAVLPQFAVAGRQMFFAEAPGPTEDKFTPRVRNTASILWKLYLGLTILLICLLKLAGMPLFDAVCNSLSTMSAGGFSPHPHSIMGYDIEKMKAFAKQLRHDIVDMINFDKGRVGHLGGSCSMADIVAALYCYKMNYDPKDYKKADRDRLVLSHRQVEQPDAPVHEPALGPGAGYAVQPHLQPLGLQRGDQQIGAVWPGAEEAVEIL